MLENTGWLLAMTLGPLILAGALLYAYARRRRLSRGEKERQHRAVQELYGDAPGQQAGEARGDAAAAQAPQRRRSSG